MVGCGQPPLARLLSGTRGEKEQATSSIKSFRILLKELCSQHEAVVDGLLLGTAPRLDKLLC